MASKTGVKESKENKESKESNESEKNSSVSGDTNSDFGIDLNSNPEVEKISVKGVISNYFYQPDWFGVHYHVNLYVGCSFGCVVCASQGRFAKHLSLGCDRLGVKENAAELLTKAVSGKRRKGVVMIGHEADPYPSIEAKTQLTRMAIKVLLAHQFNVVLLTKNPMVTRDLDLLCQRIWGLKPIVALQINTLSDQLSLTMEPLAPPASERLKALEVLAHAGVITGVYLGPLLPYVNDDTCDVEALISRIAALGAKFVVVPYSLVLSEDQRAILQKFSANMPKGYYKKLLESYGDDYCLPLPEATHLQVAVQNLCKELGLVYRMDHIEELQKNLVKDL